MRNTNKAKLKNNFIYKKEAKNYQLFLGTIIHIKNSEAFWE